MPRRKNLPPSAQMQPVQRRRCLAVKHALVIHSESIPDGRVRELDLEILWVCLLPEAPSQGVFENQLERFEDRDDLAPLGRAHHCREQIRVQAAIELQLFLRSDDVLDVHGVLQVGHGSSLIEGTLQE